MDESQRRSLIERYLHAYNCFDIDGMLALLADDVHFENVSGNEVTVVTEGVDAFGALAKQSAAMFSEREQRLLTLVFDGDRACAGIAWRGVLAHDVPEGPAAGTVLEMQGASEFAFDGDRIARILDRS
jgi:hypothetical protein